MIGRKVGGGRGENPRCGPLLIISREKDNTVPWAIANASFKTQQRNEAVTDIVEIPGPGHRAGTVRREDGEQACADERGWQRGCGQLACQNSQ